MIYCYVCPACGQRQERMAIGDSHTCVACGVVGLNRDYKTEWATQRVHIPMHMSSRNTSNKTDFLPGTADFESPSDPTGENGMKEWKDTHQLKGNRWI